MPSFFDRAIVSADPATLAPQADAPTTPSTAELPPKNNKAISITNYLFFLHLIRMCPLCCSPIFMNPRFLLLALLIPTTTFGHDLWIERNGQLHSLAYGHERSSHIGEKRLQYQPESVQQARCFDASGQELPTERGRQYPVTLKGDCGASWFLLSTGYWSKTPYGTKNLAKNQAGAVIESWQSIEAVKRLDLWGSALARPLTLELELAPIENPLGLKAGDKLRLRAWFQGKPAANVSVAYFGKPRGVSGADGAINIRLNQAGYQHIEASLEQPLNDDRADKSIHATALQFEIQ